MVEKRSFEELRSQIASLDECILLSISKRNLCSESLAELKEERSSSLRVPEIEREVYRRNIELAEKLGLEKKFVFQITKLLLRHSLRCQKRHIEKINSQKRVKCRNNSFRET